MTTAIWSFIDLNTGELTGGTAAGGLAVGFAQPAHILPVLGVWSAAEWRYDTQLQRLVQREIPSTPAVGRSELQRSVGEQVAAMGSLERRSLRPIRECLLALHRGEPMPEQAIARLHSLDADLSDARPGVQQAIRDLDP